MPRQMRIAAKVPLPKTYFKRPSVRKKVMERMEKLIEAIEATGAKYVPGGTTTEGEGFFSVEGTPPQMVAVKDILNRRNIEYNPPYDIEETPDTINIIATVPLPKGKHSRTTEKAKVKAKVKRLLEAIEPTGVKYTKLVGEGRVSIEGTPAQMEMVKDILTKRGIPFETPGEAPAPPAKTPFKYSDVEMRGFWREAEALRPKIFTKTGAKRKRIKPEDAQRWSELQKIDEAYDKYRGIVFEYPEHFRRKVGDIWEKPVTGGWKVKFRIMAPPRDLTNLKYKGMHSVNGTDIWKDEETGKTYYNFWYRDIGGEQYNPADPRRIWVEPMPEEGEAPVATVFEIKRVEDLPYNFVLTTDGDIVISSGGKFKEEPTAKEMKLALKALGLKTQAEAKDIAKQFNQVYAQIPAQIQSAGKAVTVGALKVVFPYAPPELIDLAAKRLVDTGILKVTPDGLVMVEVEEPAPVKPTPVPKPPGAMEREIGGCKYYFYLKNGLMYARKAVKDCAPDPETSEPPPKRKRRGKVSKPSPKPMETASAEEMSEDENTILALLSETPMHIDEIKRLSGFPSGKVSSALVLLELRREVQQLPGMKFVRTS